MPDLSSVAREAARAEAESHIGGFVAQTWFIEGAAWCASRLPSERDIEIAILGRTATAGAKAVLALIERGIGQNV